MKSNRITASNPEELLRTQLSSQMTTGTKSSFPGLFFAQVVNTNDPLNCNRIQVRIPLIDDVFYLDDTGNLKDDVGNEELPWCISSNSRFINTPEVDSIIVVVLFNPNKPFDGRMWFNALSDLKDVSLFESDNLNKDNVDSNNWENSEKSINVAFGSTPGLRDKPKMKKVDSGKINYLTGIRGKGNNLITLDKEIISLIQNLGTDDESKILLSKKIELLSKSIEILNPNSNTKEKPVFADPLFSFLDKMLGLVNSIILLLSASPGTSTTVGSPVLPSATASTLSASYQSVKASLTELKTNGKSKNITIN